MKQVHFKYSDLSSLEVAGLVSDAALDTKAEDLIVLDVSKISSFADYFVIMSGRSTRHVQGLAEAIDSKIRSKRTKDSNSEGLSEGLWVLLDYNDVVVHIFYSEVRKFYDLEGLWYDAPRVDLRDENKKLCEVAGC
ncbi:MAG: ribosome silencing factor [Desulfobulbaceae bacterium]|nr:ribosome silencing factor [Desulfobulbaceae bacterium]